MKLPLTAFTLMCLACTKSLAQDATKPTRRDPQPQVRYPLGKDSLPQAGVPKGKLEGPFLFKSDIIEDTIRKYWVYVPAQYTADKPANLLVFQDGARAINPNGVIRAPQVLENLIAQKHIPVTIGIFITPGQRGDEFPDSIGTGNPDNRDREYDVLNDDYARMLIEEILPEVGKKYSISTSPADRAIGGSSSGAICAFTVAWERPDQFRNVASMIGSYTNIHGGHVYPDLILAADKKPIRIFLQDGENDLRSPQNLERDWYLQNQKMVAAFQEKEYDMAHVFGVGGHSDDHGGAMLPEMLRWLWRDHPDVQQPKTDWVAQAAAIQPETQDLFPGFDAAAKVDPSGKYEWESRFGPSSMLSTIEISDQGGELAGTYTMQRDGGEAVTANLENIALEGNKLIFEVTTPFRDQQLTSTYQGIVAESGIKGWRMMEIRGQTRDSGWTADRVRNAGLLKKVASVDSWTFELAGQGKGTIKAEGDSIVFDTTALSDENWHVQAYQAGIPMTDGAKYKLSFTAMSPTSTTILVSAMINEEDWHNIGFQEEVYVGKEFREHSFTFTAEDTVANNNRISFVLGIEVGKLVLKDIALVEVK